jgi:hypothetical protein
MKFNSSEVMKEFVDECKKRFSNWYKTNKPEVVAPEPSDVYVVWSCKTLQNAKCIVAANTVEPDGIIAEYTFNGDKGELYEDVYSKLTNTMYNELS